MMVPDGGRRISGLPLPIVGLLLLSAVNVLNLLDRMIVGILAESIKIDLKLSDTQTGLLTGLAFSVCYAVCAVPIARLADRGDRAKLLSAALMLWSVMTMLCALSQSFGLLLLARLGVAVGESACSPISYALVADYFAPRFRARAMSAISVSTSVGTMLAFVMGGYIAEGYGWRASFLLVAVPGLILAGLCWLALPEPRRITPGSAGYEPDLVENAFKSIVRLIRNPVFFLLVSASCAMMFGLTALLIWTGVLFQRAYGWSLGDIGLVLGLVFGVGGMVSPMLLAVVGDRLIRSDAGAYPATLAIASGIAAPLLLVGLMSTSAGFTLAAITITFMLVGGWAPLTMAAIRLFTPSCRMALAVALLGVAMNLIGMGLGPFLVGVLSDYFDRFFGTHSVRYALMLSPCAFIIGAISMQLVAKHIRHDAASHACRNSHYI